MSPVIFEPLKMVDYSNPHRITYSGSTSENMSDNTKTLYKKKKMDKNVFKTVMVFVKAHNIKLKVCSSIHCGGVQRQISVIIHLST